MYKKAKKILKKIIPNKFLQIIRIGSQNIYYYKQIKHIQKNDCKDVIFFFGTAIHKNLGDQLITLSVYQIIKEELPNKKIIEIPTEVYQVYRKKLIKTIPKSSLIAINGGGWMGTVWKKEELLIQDILTSFCQNNIIIFPQTIYYNKQDKEYRKLIDSANNSYKKCKNLIVMVREMNSFDFAKKHLDIPQLLVAPDIALFYFDNLKDLRKEKKENVVCFCMRDDRENNNCNIDKKELNRIFDEAKLSLKHTSTISKHRVPEQKRKQEVFKKLKEFANSKFVVTDRLHGMIFSFLVGTPCIILDNKTNKVSGVYEKWLNNELIFPLYKNNNMSDLKKFIDKNIKKKKKKMTQCIDFSSIKEAIKVWQK